MAISWMSLVYLGILGYIVGMAPDPRPSGPKKKLASGRGSGFHLLKARYLLRAANLECSLAKQHPTWSLCKSTTGAPKCKPVRTARRPEVGGITQTGLEMVAF